MRLANRLRKLEQQFNAKAGCTRCRDRGKTAMRVDYGCCVTEVMGGCDSCGRISDVVTFSQPMDEELYNDMFGPDLPVRGERAGEEGSSSHGKRSSA